MKIFMSLFIVFFMCQSTFGQEEEAASLSETMDWLEGKYRNYERSYLKEPEFEDEYLDQASVSFDRVENVLIYEITSHRKGSSVKSGLTKSLYRAPIRDLNPEEIELGFYPNSEDVTIKLVTTNQKKSIVQQYWEGDESGKFNPVSSLSITLSKGLMEDFENLPDRTKKALEHLITLCGGKGEKF